MYRACTEQSRSGFKKGFSKTHRDIEKKNEIDQFLVTQSYDKLSKSETPFPIFKNDVSKIYKKMLLKNQTHRNIEKRTR